MTLSKIRKKLYPTQKPFLTPEEQQELKDEFYSSEYNREHFQIGNTFLVHERRQIPRLVKESHLKVNTQCGKKRNFLQHL